MLKRKCVEKINLNVCAVNFDEFLCGAEERVAGGVVGGG